MERSNIAEIEDRAGCPACGTEAGAAASNDLTRLEARLSQSQEKLLQTEKLASIGQLAAGVAHEINNPIGYIFSNFGSLEDYIGRLFQVLDAYETAEAEIGKPSVRDELRALRETVDLDYLKSDIPALMRESKEGISRVRKIVQDLKDFSRVDGDQQWVLADLHQGIESTLNIVQNEIKYKADVIRQFAELPLVECLPSQLNQVFMNLLMNAAQSIGAQRGTITLRSGVEGANVWVEVEDSGCGIDPDKLSRIFDPFYTTKPVGKGTGLGLSISYGIVSKHRGQIDVRSEVGAGTTFRVSLPSRRAADDGI